MNDDIKLQIESTGPTFITISPDTRSMPVSIIINEDAALLTRDETKAMIRTLQAALILTGTDE